VIGLVAIAAVASQGASGWLVAACGHDWVTPGREQDALDAPWIGNDDRRVYHVEISDCVDHHEATVRVQMRNRTTYEHVLKLKDSGDETWHFALDDGPLHMELAFTPKTRKFFYRETDVSNRVFEADGYLVSREFGVGSNDPPTPGPDEAQGAGSAR
jgi:hypothetical protein